MYGTVKNKLVNGDFVLGSWINTVSPIVAEVMAGAGFDFLTVDAEHSPVTIKDVYEISRAIAYANQNCDFLVRLPDTDYMSIKRFMDAGAHGVIAPLVNTKCAAQEVVDAVKYPPKGRRGVGFAPANDYGRNLADHLEAEYKNSPVIIQIEHVDAVANLDEILSVEHIDGVMVGPYDLSASMGVAGEFGHPDVVDAIKFIHSKCLEKNIASGIHVIQPEEDEAVMRIADGYKFIAYSLDITMLSGLCSRHVKAIKEKAVK